MIWIKDYYLRKHLLIKLKYKREIVKGEDIAKGMMNDNIISYY